MPETNRVNNNKVAEAFGAYYFSVEIEKNVQDAFFRSCSGLKSESEVVEIAEGGINDRTHKLIGRTKYPNIVLKRGFAGAASSLWKLRANYIDPAQSKGKKITRFEGVIVQMGPGGATAKWQFKDAWICKWEGPDFDASKNEISIETIEIAHEGLVSLG